MSGLSRLWQRARTNVAETDGAEPYPDLAPLTLNLPPNAAYAAALSAARAMPLWQVVADEPRAGRIVACAATPRMKFVDDVEITVEPAGAGRRHERAPDPRLPRAPLYELPALIASRLAPPAAAPSTAGHSAAGLLPSTVDADARRAVVQPVDRHAEVLSAGGAFFEVFLLGPIGGRLLIDNEQDADALVERCAAWLDGRA